MERREEIASEIRKLTKHLAHIDATIKIMQPGKKLPQPRHGALTREIFRVMREAGEPMTTNQIAEAIEAEPLQIRDALRAQRRKGMVRGVEESGKAMMWGIVK